VLAYHTEQLAAVGLVGLGFTHAPASIAPVGALRPVVGTNPIAIAVPDGHGGCSISIDQSASVVAKSEIMRRYREGRSIPEGWAFGPDGEVTTDPATALNGTMAPAGGYKGVGLALACRGTCRRGDWRHPVNRCQSIFRTFGRSAPYRAVVYRA
jgi:(2R)-3-sulfolactate dehydrogenase (NADP+)